MSTNANAYDDLFEKLLTTSCITIRSNNPKAVRVGLAKARNLHNELAAMVDMEPENRRIVVAGVKGKEDMFTVEFYQGTATFEIIPVPDEETESNECSAE